jgi:CDP-glycerol glycerophosphotransferase (TagB/SpsB family)|tara:strand:- start:740 stop:1192 length:453 start_codon:yes stop_codon:yes gene_type:complete
MDESIKEKYKKLDSNNFRIVDELNILPIMAGSDIMITDTSSVAYEFLHFNRPLVTYRAVARRDKGINIQDPSELLPAIERSLNHPDEFSQNRESCLKDIHPYFDGNSSKRMLEMIKNILANRSQNQLKQKPSNIIRKYQIRKIISKIKAQ